jgi:TetR/AcrR family transcriptional repressor of lmrAB and yxaGH operons
MQIVIVRAVDGIARRVGRSPLVARKTSKKLSVHAKRAAGKPRKVRRKPPSRSGAGPAQEDQPTRDRMVVGAATLLAQRGLQATSFSEVLEFTGAPRGSVYHHFPRGKDQLVKAALDFVSAQMGAYFSPKEGASPEEVTELFLRLWRGILLRFEFRAGCAVVAVTVAADSPELLDHAASIFRAWRSRLVGLFVAGGVAKEDAIPFAATLVAASEGAVVLSRGERSLEPFDLVASRLVEHARNLPRRG